MSLCCGIKKTFKYMLDLKKKHFICYKVTTQVTEIIIHKFIKSKNTFCGKHACCYYDKRKFKMTKIKSHFYMSIKNVLPSVRRTTEKFPSFIQDPHLRLLPALFPLQSECNQL